MPSKAQRHVNALAWCEDTVRQKHAKIGITGARPSAREREEKERDDAASIQALSVKLKPTEAKK